TPATGPWSPPSPATTPTPPAAWRPRSAPSRWASTPPAPAATARSSSAAGAPPGAAPSSAAASSSTPSPAAPGTSASPATSPTTPSSRKGTPDPGPQSARTARSPHRDPVRGAGGPVHRSGSGPSDGAGRTARRAPRYREGPGNRGLPAPAPVGGRVSGGDDGPPRPGGPPLAAAPGRIPEHPFAARSGPVGPVLRLGPCPAGGCGGRRSRRPRRGKEGAARAWRRGAAVLRRGGTGGGDGRLSGEQAWSTAGASSARRAGVGRGQSGSTR